MGRVTVAADTLRWICWWLLRQHIYCYLCKPVFAFLYSYLHFSCKSLPHCLCKVNDRNSDTIIDGRSTVATNVLINTVCVLDW